MKAILEEREVEIHVRLEKRNWKKGIIEKIYTTQAEMEEISKGFNVGIEIRVNLKS